MLPIYLAKMYPHLHSTMLLLYRSGLTRRRSTFSIYIPLCFYFIEVWRKYQRVFNQIYIPLCFYFIQGQPDPEKGRGLIYIPLCFYFIWPSHSPARLGPSFTFHYASTLSRCWLSLPCPQGIYIPLCFYFIALTSTQSDLPFSFTFHYASTLSHEFFLISYSIYIYIPLCFYFIFLHHIFETIHNLHLHSTMLLLYHADNCNMHSLLTHLHSTMLLLYLRWFQMMGKFFCIYIPLCFYFIRYSPFIHPSSKSFTFHYASTLSNELTFVFNQITHLHSTMLLLYPTSSTYFAIPFSYIYIPLCFYFIGDSTGKEVCTRYIYIPLCFYFIGGWPCSWRAPAVFTFHYASTLSRESPVRRFPFPHLHSTMLLLYPLPHRLHKLRV